MEEDPLITRCLNEISDWLKKTDDVLAQHSQSQSQIVPLHDNDVEILLTRFIDILQLKSSLEILSIMHRAVAILLYFMKSMDGKEDKIVDLIKLLIGCFIKCYQVKDQKTSEYLCQGIHDIITICSEENNAPDCTLVILDGWSSC